MDDVAVSEQPADTRPDQSAVPAGWRVRLLNLLLTADTPKRTAAAFASGVFLSFSPFLGLQIALALGIAHLFRFSRVAVFAGLCTNLPWIMVPWYTFTTLAGAAAIGAEIRAEVGVSLKALLDVPIYEARFWTAALEILTPFFWSFLIGSTIGAIIVGATTYAVIVRTIGSVRRVPEVNG